MDGVLDPKWKENTTAALEQTTSKRKFAPIATCMQCTSCCSISFLSYLACNQHSCHRVLALPQSNTTLLVTAKSVQQQSGWRVDRGCFSIAFAHCAALAMQGEDAAELNLEFEF